MTSFSYVLKDPAGIHARPATQMIQQCSTYKDIDIQIQCNGKTADAKRIFRVMSLGAKQGDEVTFTFDGPGEEEARASIQAFVEENF